MEEKRMDFTFRVVSINGSDFEDDKVLISLESDCPVQNMELEVSGEESKDFYFGQELEVSIIYQVRVG